MIAIYILSTLLLCMAAPFVLKWLPSWLTGVSCCAMVCVMVWHLLRVR